MSRPRAGNDQRARLGLPSTLPAWEKAPATPFFRIRTSGSMSAILWSSMRPAPECGRIRSPHRRINMRIDTRIDTRIDMRIDNLQHGRTIAKRREKVAVARV